MIKENYVLFLEVPIAKTLWNLGFLKGLDSCAVEELFNKKDSTYCYQVAEKKQELMNLIALAFQVADDDEDLNLVLYDKKESDLQVYSSIQKFPLIKESNLKILENKIAELYKTTPIYYL